MPGFFQHACPIHWTVERTCPTHYRDATPADIRQFEEDGFLVVTDAIDAQERAAFRELGQAMIRLPRDGAKDWDWRRGEPLEQREFRIVQSGVDKHFPWVAQSRLRAWAVRFSAALMRQDMAFWYEQFLGKPPGIGAPTPWHQDEGYWGRTLADHGITAWTAFHRVGVENGCMHFVRGGHRQLLEHQNPPEMASDLLICDIPADAEVVACPIEEGSVTFHHSKTPHMTTANVSGDWRLALSQHLRNPACAGLPEDNYAWRVKVRQRDDA